MLLWKLLVIIGLGVIVFIWILGVSFIEKVEVKLLIVVFEVL